MTTSIPRWSADPEVGVAELELAVPVRVVSALVSLADRLGVPLRTVLLAAHAVVLSRLSGERLVTTGYLAGELTLPRGCSVTTEPESWRALIAEAARAEATAHDDAADPAYEVEFDPTGVSRGLQPGTVLSVGFMEYDGRLAVRLRYRTEVLDAPAAGRIAGYHRIALGLLASDPEADHAGQSLLSAAERDLQLGGLTGPARTVPDLCWHQLVEERAHRHPMAVAAVCGERQWTYGELNARANRLARSLRERGLRHEDVVAVVTERSLEWLAGVLAIAKAGGAYLPIEPHFPANRIQTVLARAGCRTVLVGPGARDELDQALAVLPEVRSFRIRDGIEDGEDSDLDLEIGPTQLAYIYFTSGSTGEPKGAMCEHAGMLNHLLAKVDDLRIGGGDVVAQTAPIGFDISLWQLVAGLLVGGRTLIIEQPVVLDVERLLDTVVAGAVAVLQVVPSYLDAVMASLEQAPRALPDLRYVSVTGEALSVELARRWFAVQPGIRLLNAYGLTETSDDTNHEVITEAPGADGVALGRPINNVRAYVVGPDLELVPLGAPGELVFSGICVGRGYVNDVERTRTAYLADPHRVGERLYRSGDFGRWRPDGKLEFLGRRDSQVKISGHRIEISEIEAALDRLPGIRGSAVVVAERADRSRHLVGFYTGAGASDADLLRQRLAARLPAYLMPTVLCRVPELPLTDNGKVDRKRLVSIAGAIEQTKRDVRRTPGERALADVWAAVLGLPSGRIGPHDSFFGLGGTSLSAVKLVVRLNRALSVKEITAHPTLAQQAHLLGRASLTEAERNI